jgi:hypothetical protein
MGERHHNPYSKYPVIGKSFPVAQTIQCNVYLFCQGGEWDGAVIRAEVQDAPARGDDGSPLPPVIVIPCPRCGRGLKIDGVAKGVHSENLSPPRQLDLRAVGFGLVQQTRVLSVREDLGCPYAESDAPCGARFRIEGNVLYKVEFGGRRRIR